MSFRECGKLHDLFDGDGYLSDGVIGSYG